VIQHDGGRHTVAGDLCSCDDDDYTPLVEQSAHQSDGKVLGEGEEEGGRGGGMAAPRLRVRIRTSAVYLSASLCKTLT